MYETEHSNYQDKLRLDTEGVSLTDRLPLLITEDLFRTSVITLDILDQFSLVFQQPPHEVACKLKGLSLFNPLIGYMVEATLAGETPTILTAIRQTGCWSLLQVGLQSEIEFFPDDMDVVDHTMNHVYVALALP